MHNPRSQSNRRMITSFYKAESRVKKQELPTTSLNDASTDPMHKYIYGYHQRTFRDLELWNKRFKDTLNDFDLRQFA